MPRLPRSVIVLACPMLIAACGAWVSAQDADTKFTEWKKVEGAPPTVAYKNKLREGTYDEAGRKFLTTIALPQLELESNRATIDRVRRRMRELLLTDDGNRKAFEGVAATVVEFMNELARRDDAAMPVRVNAMLLVGELKPKDGAPVAEVVTALTTALGDAALPMPVRIAAASGLALQVDTAVAAGPEAVAAVGTAAVPVLVPVVDGPPAGGDQAAADWLVSRSLAMLARLAPADAPQVTTAANKILGDSARGLDLRVRAAAVVAATLKAGGGVDADKTVADMRNVAIAALQAEEEIAARRRFVQSTASGPGGGSFAPPPGAGFPGAAQQPMIPELACRRAAWRLSVLADAVATADATSGVALLATDVDLGKELAKRLRDGAKAIDQRPNEKSILETLASLGADATAGGESAADDQPQKPAKPAGNNSPFDSPFSKPKR